jgi:hypothetical protein
MFTEVCFKGNSGGNMCIIVGEIMVEERYRRR